MSKDKSQISDGYHTFEELYNHRHELFVTLMSNNPEISWYADFHEDGTMWDGWFIAGMNLPTGDISYHLPIHPYLKDVRKAGVWHNTCAPKWDGHTSTDVLNRLSKWRRGC